MSAEPLYLSRARLRTERGEALSALAPVLLMGSKGDTVSHAHRILWMLFQNKAESEGRDFLWREERPGHYLILSRDPPDNRGDLFALESKDFAPNLRAGDLLSFALRANPVVSRKQGWEAGKEKRDRKGRVRGMRCDIVMDALSPLGGFGGSRDEEGRTERAQKRDEATAAAALNWMRAQGKRCGFKLAVNPESDAPYLKASNYETISIPRIKGTAFQPPAKFGVLDFEGIIEVTDPGLFLGQLARGFGKAKAFGCGLMLIRRA
jgi:CRISPR system Cascade subunit CasE